MMQNIGLEELLELAKSAAFESGRMLAGLDDRSVASSEGKDIKLDADRRSEELIIDRFLARSTEYGILSEERGLTQGQDGSRTWIVDPLDGSANFSRGMDGLCCVSIALWEGDTPLLGAVYRFGCGQMYSGIAGIGAWKNGQCISTSGTASVCQAVLATGFPVFRDYSDDALTAFVRDVQRFKKVRMLGAAALMGALVAEGKIDAFMEDGIMLWDVAASVAIAKAAGATIDCKAFAKEGDYRRHCRIYANRTLEADYTGCGGRK